MHGRLSVQPVLEVCDQTELSISEKTNLLKSKLQDMGYSIPNYPELNVSVCSTAVRIPFLDQFMVGIRLNASILRSGTSLKIIKSRTGIHPSVLSQLRKATPSSQKSVFNRLNKISENALCVELGVSHDWLFNNIQQDHNGTFVSPGWMRAPICLMHNSIFIRNWVHRIGNGQDAIVVKRPGYQFSHRPAAIWKLGDFARDLCALMGKGIMAYAIACSEIGGFAYRNKETHDLLGVNVYSTGWEEHGGAYEFDDGSDVWTEHVRSVRENIEFAVRIAPTILAYSPILHEAFLAIAGYRQQLLNRSINVAVTYASALRVKRLCLTQPSTEVDFFGPVDVGSMDASITAGLLESLPTFSFNDGEFCEKRRKRHADR